MSMKRNRNGVGKERIMMMASAALVLTALTVTGVFVRSSRKAEENGNVLDFSAIENGENSLPEELDEALFAEVGTDDLDYDPNFQEANSDSVENVGNLAKKTEAGSEEDTDKALNEASDETSDDASDEGADGQPKQSGQNAKAGQKTEKDDTKKDPEDKEGMFDGNKEGVTKTTETSETTKTTEASGTAEAAEVVEDREAIATTVQPALDFSEEDELVWPIVGNILINYSMDKTIYFETLQQYKYNPGIVIAAQEGEIITAAADGRVVSVAYDSQLGNTVVMDLGNQYELTYGQLENITVSEGSYVATGDIIGSVAHPTKYYSTEGANVYFKLTKDGEPVNPMGKLKQ